MFEIRKAFRSDAFAIRKLIRQVRINPSGVDWRRFIVAVDLNGKVIGCAQLKPHKSGGLELASVAVSRPYRSQGIAGTMIRHLMQNQKGPLYLTCRIRMSGYYERFGFLALNEYHDMPPYFRKVKRIFNLVAALFAPEDGLAVMVCRKCDS